MAVDDLTTALVFRHLEDLSEPDREALRQFGEQHDLQIMLQSGGPDTVQPLWPENPPPLAYELKQQSVQIEFQPMISPR